MRSWGDSRSPEQIGVTEASPDAGTGLQDVLKSRKAPDALVPLGRLLRERACPEVPQVTWQDPSVPHERPGQSPLGHVLDTPLRPHGHQLGLDDVENRMVQSFKPEGFEGWYAAMKKDPFSQGGRVWDGDRAVEIAAGNAPSKLIWDASQRGTIGNLGVTSHMVEAMRRVNSEALLSGSDQDRRYVILGAPASGKTHTATELAKAQDTRFAASVGFLKTGDPVGHAIHLANAGDHSGKKPVVVFVFNPDLDQVAQRYAAREAAEQRSVPMDAMASEWREGPGKILEGAEKYKGQFELKLVNASNGRHYVGADAMENLKYIAEQMKGLDHDQVRDAIEQGVGRHQSAVPV